MMVNANPDPFIAALDASINSLIRRMKWIENRWLLYDRGGPSGSFLRYEAIHRAVLNQVDKDA